MTANAKPLILADNRLDNGTPTATDTGAGFDVLNLKDLRTYTYWQALSFGTKYITVDTYDSDDYLAAVNFVTNGGFADITGWGPVNCDIAAIAGGASGNCLEITRVMGEWQEAIKDLDSALEIGKTYLIRAKVKSGTSGNESFSIRIMSDEAVLGYLNGVSSSEWVEYYFLWTCTSTDILMVSVLKNSHTAGTMLFDEVGVYESVSAATTANALGIIGHNFETAGATISLGYSVDGANWTEIVSGFTVTTNKALLKTFTLTSAFAWRLKIITAAIAPRMAVLMIGTRLDFERYAFNYEGPEEKIAAESLRSETGNLLGSCLKYIGYTIKLSFKNLTAAWCDVTFKPLWDSWLSQLKPFFFAPDITNHPTEVYYVKIPDSATFKMPYTSGGVRRDLDLTFEGLKEVA